MKINSLTIIAESLGLSAICMLVSKRRPKGGATSLTQAIKKQWVETSCGQNIHRLGESSLNGMASLHMGSS